MSVSVKRRRRRKHLLKVLKVKTRMALLIGNKASRGCDCD
jgi:hypothetical protein